MRQAFGTNKLKLGSERARLGAVDFRGAYETIVLFGNAGGLGRFRLIAQVGEQQLKLALAVVGDACD